jgi:hypothetical protein
METHDAANSFPMMDAKRYAELRDDIRANGLCVPITLCGGKILDGRNRHRACVELGIEPRFTEFDGNPWDYAWSLNGQRRDLSDEVRYLCWRKCNAGSESWLADMERIQEEREAKIAEVAKSRERSASGAFRPRQATVMQATSTATTAIVANDEPEMGRPDVEHSAPHLDRTEDRHVSLPSRAAAAKVNIGAVQRGEKLASNRPDLAEKVVQGELSPKAAHRQMSEDQREARKEERRTTVATSVEKRYRVEVCDIRKAIELVEPDSVDWIITDPPYPEEFVPLFSDLSRFAAHALKPGGSLICMVGQFHLPEYLRRLSESLSYHWACAYTTPGGQAVQVFPRKVNTFWKPLLWFVKGEYRGDWVGDVTTSVANDNDKRFHHWGQSESGLADIISRFTDPGDTICDPFCGGGSTGSVAVSLDRLFVGLDIAEEHALATAERCAEAIRRRE